MANVTQYAVENLEFGIEAADAPVMTGMAIRTAEFIHEADVLAEAKDGEGHTEAFVVNKPTKRRITARFGGYITSQDYKTALTVTYDSKTFVITSISAPRTRGEYVEVTVEAVHDPACYA